MIESNQTSNYIFYNLTAMTEARIETLLKGVAADGILHREVGQGRS